MSLLSALSLRAPRWVKAPQHLFDHLSFRTKFVVIGMVLAGPLSTLVGFVASRYDHRVDQAQARESALLRSSHLRDLALALAVHGACRPASWPGRKASAPNWSSSRSGSIGCCTRPRKAFPPTSGEPPTRARARAPPW